MSNGQQSLFGNSDENTTEYVRPDAAEVEELLAEHLLKSGVSSGRVRLARELVKLEAGLSAMESRALFMAVIVGLEAQSQGSTFVPMPSDGEYFRGRLQDLVPDSVRRAQSGWTAKELGDVIEKLLERRDLDLVGTGAQWKPLVVDSGRLYHQRMMLHETRLVEAVADRLGSPRPDRDEASVKSALVDVRRRQPPGRDGMPMTLSAEQEYALLTALNMPLTLITGGPGTGKTSIVVSILRLLVRLGVSPKSIALAAPTGKAANRMAESIYGQLDKLIDPGEEDRKLAEELDTPRTLHRLMGYSPRRDSFNHHLAIPLPQKMIIVDEASMIDLFLMERLLRAVSPRAQLVLLGDADQLPSVDTGAVLRDLIPDVVSTDAPWRELVDGELEKRSGTAPTAEAAVRLERSYRMRKEDPAGREILSFAREIRDFDDGDGLKAPKRVELFESYEGAAGESVEEMLDPGDGVGLWEGNLDRFARWWFGQVVLGGAPGKWRSRFNQSYELDVNGRLTAEAAKDIRILLDHYRKARVLTLTRVFETGSVRLNEAFHRATARLGADRRGQDYDFHPGEPVMMLRNDYDRNLFNGDQGVIVWCERMAENGERELSLMAVFERVDELIAYSLAELRGVVEHAFAMTVHKAQGSEFERVAMVLPEQPMALLNRELLYTGLTRASRAVLLVGDPDMLAKGAANRSERFSAVGEKLEELIRTTSRG